MTNDNPFSEPSDTDKTVILPNPGGRRLQAPPPRPGTAQPPTNRAPTSTPTPQHSAQAAPPRKHEPDSVPPGAPHVRVDAAPTGLNALNAAASPLFLLVGRIRNRAQHSDPVQLRESVIAEIRAFEDRALHALIPSQSVKVARYAICATVDDVVLNTPWGGQSIWAQQSMVGTFHKETHGGDRFYDLLDRLKANPAENRDLLEFLYMCLSLGFEGRLRVESRGTEKHLSARQHLARMIRLQRGAAEPDLALRWQGASVAHRPISAWMPVWLLAGLTVGTVSLAFFGFSFALSFDAERVRGQLLALEVDGPVELARAAPPPPAPEPTVEEVADIDRIRTFLAQEIAQGRVAVLSQGNAITVRITGEGMFGSGSDTLAEDFMPIVDRIAAALIEQRGNIIVAGHSDNIPINTARFPSNVFLSLARAQTVMDRMSTTLAAPARLSAEGRADAQPIAPNDTPEGRAQNRRIEVILVKAG